MATAGARRGQAGKNHALFFGAGGTRVLNPMCGNQYEKTKAENAPPGALKLGGKHTTDFKSIALFTTDF